MKKQAKYDGVLIGAALALLLGGAAWTGLMQPLDRQAEDALYQRPEPLDGRVIVVGITSEDLERFGAWPWSREIIAQAVENLNADPETAPAAIGLDVLFSSPTDAEADVALVRACSADNVVAACSAEYDTRISYLPDGTADVDTFHVASTIRPFAALSAVCETGHINAMYDEDGVLRHHLWAVSDGEGRAILSMPERLYEKYCAYHGETADFDPPRSAQGFWYVDYTARPGGFYEYSLSELYDGDFDPALTAGSAVLIGPYDTGLSDDYVTAIDHASRMYGVEYLANVLTAMLNGRAIHETDEGIQVIALVLLSFVLWLLFERLSVERKIALLLAVLAASVGGSVLAYHFGWLTHVLWLPIGAAAAFGLSFLRSYIAVRQEKTFLRRTFQRYLDPEVLREVLREDPDELGLPGRTVNIAVLFVDVRGFTSLSEKLAPTKVVQLLNQYLTLTSDCVYRNHGTLDKFVGDCTMAFWGAPLACEDPVYRACRAAMDMKERSAELGARLEKQFGQPVSFGIGVHYGEAVVGNIGSSRRMDYTAIGDTVNTAARLEANAPASTIYISQTVADMLGERAVVRPLEQKLQLKGKKEPLPVFILQELDSDSPTGKGREL